MKKLIKTFSTKPDEYGFKNIIEVTVDYDPEQDSIDNLSVRCFSHRKVIFIDITDIFELAEFADLIDNIPWHQLYRDNIEEPTKDGLFEMIANITRDHARITYGINL